MHDLSIQRNPFQIAVRGHQNRRARRLVHAPRFDADIPVFDHIHAANGVFAADFVEIQQDVERRLFDRAVVRVRHFDRQAVLKFDFQQRFPIRRGLRRNGQREHVLSRAQHRVFQNSGFVADVHDVFVFAVRLFQRGLDRNAVLFGVIQQIRSALKLVQKFPIFPRRDDLNRRVQRVEGQFEPHLIVPFAGRAVRNVFRALFVGDFDMFLGNHRPRQ